MQLSFPGHYKLEVGRIVPVYWEERNDISIGSAKLVTTNNQLRATITFLEMILPSELMTSIQNKPNVWGIGTVKDEVQYLVAKIPQKRIVTEKTSRYYRFGERN